MAQTLGPVPVAAVAPVVVPVAASQMQVVRQPPAKVTTAEPRQTVYRLQAAAAEVPVR